MDVFLKTYIFFGLGLYVYKIVKRFTPEVSPYTKYTSVDDPSPPSFPVMGIRMTDP